MKYEFLVAGAGAIGSIIAAHLARAGHSVCVLARGARADDIKQHGLRIRGLAKFDIPVDVTTDCTELLSANILIVATKTPDTADLIASLNHVKIDAVFSIQNGLLKNELLCNAFPPSRVLGALANTSGELLTSGEVNFTRNVNLMLGELDGGLTERAAMIAADLDKSGVRACAVEDIVSLEWSKFVSWVPLMILSITTRAETWKYLSNTHSASLVCRLVKEVVSLLEAQSFKLIDDGSLLPLDIILRGTESEAIDAVVVSGKHYRDKAPGHKMSSLQDLQAGRALEVHETLGFAVQKSRQLSVDTPLLDSFYELAASINETR